MDRVEKETMVAIMTDKGEAVATGTAKMVASDILKAKEGIACKTDHVYMVIGTYPKMW